MAASSSPDRDQTATRLSRRELMLIVAFWTFMAVLIAANRLLDPRGQGLRSSASGALVGLAVVECYMWALLTPLIFWLASRFSAAPRQRGTSVLVLLAAGIVIAVLLDTAMAELRFALLPPPPGRAPTTMRPLLAASRLWFLNDFVMYLGVLAAGLARDFSLRYRARREDAVRLQAEAAHLEAQLADARLDALRRQLDPHFLFNTLNAISALVERDPRGVRRMIARLSELLRYSMEGATEPEIPLERELDLLGRYIEIMKIRFQGTLDVQTDIQDAARSALVPNLILQPLVENAIKHGTSRIEGDGRILIEAAAEGTELVLRVRDNGPGLTGPTDAASTGVGVRNTIARLHQLYGDAGTFVLRADADGGTTAELRLPLRRAVA